MEDETHDASTDRRLSLRQDPEAPQLVYRCHCVDCQRLTSSAFSMGSLSPTRPFASWGLSSASYNARQIVGA